MDLDNVQAPAFKDAYHVNSTLLRQRHDRRTGEKGEEEKRKKATRKKKVAENRR
ncbi:hypothetical protein TRV_01336 [Trichophyton verrucosum HKI 0517]|uniref:Uncharacterized protein n=1 Tax=Trichophyton verrucosum (strain HKI 0517) TaxID=663202 RepID=D4D2N0_TRIVH|nr:uncharacterized protein TRV_01336 [Trichophyton verrucosum HKI 0517]EFE43894.1 hypothetical protein TRV_01336 [Trichophyton verrucosum HKI 0517]